MVPWKSLSVIWVRTHLASCSQWQGAHSKVCWQMIMSFLSDYLFILLTEDFSSEFFWFCDAEWLLCDSTQHVKEQGFPASSPLTANEIRGMQTEELPQQVGLVLSSSSRLGLDEQALLAYKLERISFFSWLLLVSIETRMNAFFC